MDIDKIKNTVICGDCLEVMRQLPDKCVDLVLTDPPYGCKKSEWDNSFPTEWYPEARRIGKMVGIITGSCGLKETVRLVGDDFIDVISARNKNGMTRGPLGFGNWLAIVIACGKPEQGTNFFDFSVNGDMPEHPSPKPISFMLKLIERLSNVGDLILDCFIGSGTTAVACKRTGRDFIGIEISPEYCDIARARILQAETGVTVKEQKAGQKGLWE